MERNRFHEREKKKKRTETWYASLMLHRVARVACAGCVSLESDRQWEIGEG